MVQSFIMIEADTGRAEALLEAVRELGGVAEANIVAGDYDVIIEAEAEEVYEVIDAVATEVRSLEDVVDTKTYVCLE